MYVLFIDIEGVFAWDTSVMGSSGLNLGHAIWRGGGLPAVMGRKFWGVAHL
jgi:hypothetical protein